MRVILLDSEDVAVGEEVPEVDGVAVIDTLWVRLGVKVELDVPDWLGVTDWVVELV